MSCIRTWASWSMYEMSAQTRTNDELRGAFNSEKYKTLDWNDPASRAWRQVVRRELRKRRLGT